MFDDYKKKVLLAYQKKRAAGTISINLLSPSPGKLRAECLQVYKEGCLPKDENILRSFFGPKDQSPDYSRNIKNVEIGRFKPLIRFLKETISNPDEKNIELLAWLIDFEPRPYKFGHNYKDQEEKKIDKVPSITENKDNVLKLKDGNEPKQNDHNESKSLIKGNEKPDKEINNPVVGTIVQNILPAVTKNYGFRKIVPKALIPFMAILLATGSTLLFLSTRNQQCMYWTGDRYESISCNQKMAEKSIIAFDTIKVAYLKKITLPDTITQNSLGRVWYAKIDGELEFYTSGGFHPIYTDKRLRPMTPYILVKYLRK